MSNSLETFFPKDSTTGHLLAVTWTQRSKIPRTRDVLIRGAKHNSFR